MSILNRRQDENITPTPPLENKTRYELLCQEPQNSVETNPPQPPHSFIPTPLASAYMTKVTDDFKSTKADHARAGREVVEQHKSVTEYYVNLIKSTKLKAVRVIDAHKLEIFKAKTDYDDLKTKTEIEIAELKVRALLPCPLRPFIYIFISSYLLTTHSHDLRRKSFRGKATLVI